VLLETIAIRNEERLEGTTKKKEEQEQKHEEVWGLDHGLTEIGEQDFAERARKDGVGRVGAER
jgi:hypothetical protein